MGIFVFAFRKQLCIFGALLSCNFFFSFHFGFCLLGQNKSNSIALTNLNLIIVKGQQPSSYILLHNLSGSEPITLTSGQLSDSSAHSFGHIFL